jgi:hypothetical protein
MPRPLYLQRLDRRDWWAPKPARLPWNREKYFPCWEYDPCRPTHSLSRLSHILLSHLRFPQPGGPGPRIYIPQEQVCPIIPPGTGFPFRSLLRLAGLRWRYSNQPPHGQSLRSSVKDVGFFSGAYEELCTLGCNSVYSVAGEPIFCRMVSPPV